MVQTIIKPKKPKIKGKAEVLFILDVSGSMQDCLENLKDNLVELSSQIATISEEEYGAAPPDISYNAMGYRDFTTGEPDEYIIVKNSNEFTKDLNEIKTFFSEEKMQAMGGGDDPESALDALVIGARDMNWTKRIRMIILFTDAPTHTVLHPKQTQGVQLDEDESMSKVVEKITSRKIRTMIFALPGIKEYKRIGNLDNCQYIELEGGEETLKNFKDSDLFRTEIVELIAKSVSASASSPPVFKS
jgi:hypothetical protein